MCAASSRGRSFGIRKSASTSAAGFDDADLDDKLETVRDGVTSLRDLSRRLEESFDETERWLKA